MSASRIALLDSASVTAFAVLSAALPGGAGQAPEWIKLLDIGANKPVDGRAPWLLSNAQAVADASMVGQPLPIDTDHAIDRAAPQGLPAPAVGWIAALDARPDGLWARVEWTPDGAKALADRAWRFVSPAIQYDEKTNVIKRVLRASLTNNPALAALPALADRTCDQRGPMDELLKQLRPLLGLADGATAADVAAGVKALADQTKVAGEAGAKQALTALADAAGLPATATTDQVAAAVKALRGQEPALALLQSQVTTLGQELSSFKARERDGRIAVLMTEGRITPAEKDGATALLDANPALFEQVFAARTPVVASGVALAGAQPPGGGGGLTPDETALCRAMGLSQEAYKNVRDGK